MAKPRWRVYYGDGSVLSNQDIKSLRDLPTWDVACIVQRDRKHNKNMPMAADFYLLIDGQWFPVDTFGFFDHVLNNWHQIECILSGRYISNEDFKRIVDRAVKDPDFQPKSAGQGRFKGG